MQILRLKAVEIRMIHHQCRRLAVLLPALLDENRFAHARLQFRETASNTAAPIYEPAAASQLAGARMVWYRDWHGTEHFGS